MKKKKWIMVIITFVGILLVALTSFLFFRIPENIVSEEVINQKDFLEDKDAILYFSTTADQDIDGGGKSYAVFVNNKGLSSSFEMGGLELGNIGVDGYRVLLEDKERFYLVGEGLKKVKRDGYQHTGDSVGYVEHNEGFYAIFNSGYDKETGDYRSDLYWEEGNDFNKSVIPHFIEASGTQGNILFLQSTSEDENSYDIYETKIGAKTKPKLFSSVEKEAESTTFGQLLVDDENIFFIVQAGANTNMVKINKTTKEYKSIPITKYDNDNSILYQQTPFSFKRCAFLYNQFVYFIDGFGQVFKIDTDTYESELAFSLSKEALIGDSLEIYQKNDTLYLVTLNHEEQAGLIEQYDLVTEKKNRADKIKNLPKLRTFNKQLYLYDFVILKE
ncbi:hypothetical protein [Cytobacillus purgationiresistens]|uniref:Uncharacterized protein n=1 Tax=Cytobacillus purgationiresistens TaxID=863449 RepID=A0ABU0AQ66_9BACI|nr:hypothetical protein [Cytobacillus purgationiresistens]MDQ0272989.1 hypothetical protein [Cytobacillus purgationiresistens]